MRTFVGKEGFRFLDEREMRLTSWWFHYSTTEVFAGQFRSPDWQLWRAGDFDAAVATMRGLTTRADRQEVWRVEGVRVTRVQVVDCAAIRDPGSPVNYLLTYLQVTHPQEDRLIVDAERCVALGVDLPSVDFLIHDDEVVFTKYEGEPGVIYRDAYFNTPPDPGQDDDRPSFRRYATAAQELLARREEIRYRGRLFGVDLAAKLTGV